MPLTGNFSLRDVSNQYGSNTRPAILSLRTFYVDIFGSAPAGSRLSDFTGYGKPIITNVSAAVSSSLGGKIDITFDLDVGSLTTDVEFQYQEGSGQEPQGTWIDANTFPTYSVNQVGETQTIDVPNPDTSYFVRVVAINEFVGAHVNDFIYSDDDVSFSSGAEQWDKPIINSASIVGSNIRVFWNYDDEPSSFEAQYDENSNGNWENATLVTSNNWGTLTDPKEGNWEVGRAISGGRVRIRASAEGGVIASNWSDPENL